MQLSLTNVSMRFGALILFEDVSTTFISGGATPSPAPTVLESPL